MLMPAAGILRQTIICAVYPRSYRTPAPMRVQGRTPMKLPRRKFLHLAAAAAALPAVSGLARAQDYPARPVRLIVGFAAGGTTDITARLIGQWLSERLHPPIVNEKPARAAPTIAPQTAARAPAGRDPPVP